MARILVIDDEEDMRSLLQKFLEDNGHEVIVAENGQIGLECYQQKPCDLILTDIIMPEKEGLETIREFRERFPEAKIIAISGGDFLGHSYLEQACLLGASQVLSKPLDMDTLLQKIEKMLK